MLFKLSNLYSNLAVTLGYLNRHSFEQLGPGVFRAGRKEPWERGCRLRYS